MKIYAQINEVGICTAISMLSGEVNQENLIPIDSIDEDLLYRKFENGQWSSEKYIPPTTAQETLEDKISRIEDTNFILMDALATVYEEVSMLRTELGGIST